MNLLQSNNNSSSLFGGGGNTGGGTGLFGSNTNTGGSSGGMFGTPMFGAQQNTGLGAGNGLFSSPNKGLGGGNMIGGGFGETRGTMQVKYEPQKNKDGLFVQSITANNACKNKTLDELRAEDYAFIKAGQVPDDVKAKLEQNYRNQGTGGGMGGLGGGLLGGNTASGGTSSLFGGGNAGGGGGGLFGQSTQNSSVGGLAAPTLQRGNVIPGTTGTNTGGGLFGGTNTQQGGGGGLFGGQGGATGGGGLFGSKPAGQTGGGGLFGGGNQGGNTGGGGLFGGQGGGATGGGGLFGSKPAGQTGGLFGNTGGQQGGAAGGGGLFGNQGGAGAAAGGGGLFGSKPAGQTGGLFGNTGTQQGAGGGGLFGGQGGNTGGGGGLFGNKPAGQTGGLFGGAGTQQGGGTGGGLFGGQGAGATGGGGLFGGQGAGATGGGGLFGGGNTGGGLFGGQKPGVGQQANPHLFGQGDAYSAFLANIDPSWYPKLMENAPSATPGSPKNKEAPAAEKKVADGLYVPYRSQENLKKEDQGYRGKKSLNELAMSLGNTSSLNQRDRTVEYMGANGPYNPFEKIGTTKIQENDKKISDSLSLKRRLGPHSIVKRMNEDQSYDRNTSFIDNHLEIMLRPKAINRSFYTETPSRRSSRSVLDDLNESRSSIGSKKKSIYNNSVTVELGLSFGGRNEESSILVQIYSGATILDLKRKALDTLVAKGTGKLVDIADTEEGIEELTKRSNVFMDCRLLPDNATLLQAGITQANNRAFLYIDMGQHIPRPPKDGYYTIPSMDELAEMSQQQLKRVEGFTIGNHWGKIEFLGETDVSGVDLDELVYIHHGEAEVYPDDKFPREDLKPPRGQKLNKPAIITLYQCNLKKSSKKSGSGSKSKEEPAFEVLGYNRETGEYKIKVEHFTKYTFGESEGEDEDHKEEHPQKLKPYQPSDIRTPGAPDDFGGESQDQMRKPIMGVGPRRAPEQMEIQEIHGESLESDSDKLKRIFGDKDKAPQDIPANDEEMFGSSDEDQETYSQQFRKRHAGQPKRKILKGNQERIIIEPELRDDDLDDFEEELAKEDREREPEEIPAEKFDEETAFSQTKLSELLSLADNFSAHTRDRLQQAKTISGPVKARCQKTLNSLELLNKRVMGKTDQLINVNERQFYLNRSFRVGWTKNGFASPGVGKTISIRKVIVHRGLGSQTDEERSAFSFERYKRNLSFVVKGLYEPLLRALVNNSVTMEGMEDLSLNESQRNKGGSSFLKFPDSQGLARGLIEYIETVSSKQQFLEGHDERLIDVFGEVRLRDVEILSLLNTLFGRCELDLWKHAIAVEKDELSEEEKDVLLKKLERNVENDRHIMITRKHGLSKWLERKSAQLIDLDLQKVPSISEEILLYLSGRQLKTATDFCNKMEMNRLAVQLSMLNTNKPTKEAFRQQLLEWEQSNFTKDISVRDVYAFLSGKTSVVNLYDWTRFFGVELWYLAQPSLTVAEVVRDFYQNKLRRDNDSYNTAVSIFYNPDSDSQNKRYLELGWLLVALYAEHPDFNIQKHFNPYTYTSDFLDVKFLWIITEFLTNTRPQTQRGGFGSGFMTIERPRNSREEVEYRYRVLRGFCYQMELLGLWEYAVYAILVASSEVIKEGDKSRYVREIIQRNYKDAETLSSDIRSKGIKKKSKKKQLLVEILGVNQNILRESRAYRYLNAFAYSKAAKSLIKCGSLRDAHTILCQQLAPIAVCNSWAHGRNTEEAQSALVDLERQLQTIIEKNQTVVNWDREGDILSKYLAEYNRNGAGGLSLNDLAVLAGKVELFEKSQKSLLGKIMVDKIRRDLASIIMKRMRDTDFALEKGRVLDCIERLDAGNKEDKTALVLQFVEKDASCCEFSSRLFVI